MVKNPTKYWLGKKLPQEMIEKIKSTKIKDRFKYLGTNNPFYGKKHSEISKRKMSDSHRASYENDKTLSQRTSKNKPQNIDHSFWKGEDAHYISKHSWVSRWKGKPSKCEHCGTTRAKKFEWANVDHKYRRILDDYIRLCTKCHKKYDKR